MAEEYLDLFVAEARELVSKAVEVLGRVSKEPSAELVNELFRVFHTLKGNAGMMGLTRIAELCHKVEDVLHRVREGKEQMSKELVDKLMVVAGKLDEALSRLEAGESADEVVEEAFKVLGVSEEASAPKKEPVKIELSEEEKEKAATAISRGLHVYRVELEFGVDPAMMVFRYFQAVHKLGEAGELIKVIPESIEEVKTNKLVAVVAVKKLEDLEEAVKNLQDLSKYDLVKLKPEDVGATIEEVAAAAPEPLDKEAVMDEIERLIKRVEEGEEGEGPPEARERKLEEVKVSVKHLDELFNLVGELVLVKSRLYSLSKQYDSPELKEVLATFSRLVSELQDQVMRLRLTPLHELFKSLPAYVKELAMKYSKDVDLYYEGGEIAVDRKVLERIAEPLRKLLEVIVRDSIETPEVRAKKGKTRVGAVRISASREGNQVVITVEEDGAGMDADEVRFRAVELGLASPAAAEKLSREEVFMLATLPGFSLRDGRFSGLDAVRKAIESLGGSFEVFSHVDTETRYVIKVPVSMATLRALLVRLGEDVYAIPVSSIVAVMSVNSIDRIGAEKLLRFHDKLIPLHDLAELLGASGGNGGRKRYAIVVEKRSKYSAVLVDEALGQEDIVVKALSKIVRNVKGLSGATILGDGRVCLILDLPSLLP